MEIPKTYLFYKNVRGLSPQYLTKYLRSNCAPNYQTRAIKKKIKKKQLKEFSFRTEGLKYSFFPFWMEQLGKAKSIGQFKSMLTILTAKNLYFTEFNTKIH